MVSPLSLSLTHTHTAQKCNATLKFYREREGHQKGGGGGDQETKPNKTKQERKKHRNNTKDPKKQASNLFWLFFYGLVILFMFVRLNYGCYALQFCIFSGKEIRFYTYVKFQVFQNDQETDTAYESYDSVLCVT